MSYALEMHMEYNENLTYEYYMDEEKKIIDI
jgi:hypothetical protein